MPGGKNTTYSKAQWRTWKRAQRANPGGKLRCSKCGKQGVDHAHMGSTSNLTAATKPLCRSCHTRRDNLAGLHRP